MLDHYLWKEQLWKKFLYSFDKWQYPQCNIGNKLLSINSISKKLLTFHRISSTSFVPHHATQTVCEVQIWTKWLSGWTGGLRISLKITSVRCVWITSPGFALGMEWSESVVKWLHAEESEVLWERCRPQLLPYLGPQQVLAWLWLFVSKGQFPRYCLWTALWVSVILNYPFFLCSRASWCSSVSSPS